MNWSGDPSLGGLGGSLGVNDAGGGTKRTHEESFGSNLPVQNSNRNLLSAVSSIPLQMKRMVRAVTMGSLRMPPGGMHNQNFAAAGETSGLPNATFGMMSNSSQRGVISSQQQPMPPPYGHTTLPLRPQLAAGGGSNHNLNNMQPPLKRAAMSSSMKSSDFIAMQRQKKQITIGNNPKTVTFSQGTSFINDNRASTNNMGYRQSPPAVQHMSMMNLGASRQNDPFLSGQSMQNQAFGVPANNSYTQAFPAVQPIKVYTMADLPKPSSRFLPKLPSEVNRQAKKDPRLMVAAMDSESLLHNSCKLYPDNTNIVQSAYEMDPEAIRRNIPLVCFGPQNKEGDKYKRPLNPEKFGYPINIALKYRSSSDVLDALLLHGPDVVALPDGPDKAGSLSIALQLRYEEDVIRKIIETNPACTRTTDRHLNVALHLAARSPQTSLEVVKAIYEAYPTGLQQRNFHRETPIDVAVRSPFCPEEVLNYLQSLENHVHEDDAKNRDHDKLLDSLK